MTAPIRITPETIAVPAPGDIIARVRCHDDLIEAFRVMKDLLGLSNTFCDDTIGITAGHTDKVLGPTRAKGLSSFMFDNFSELFAVEFEMRINLDAAKRMQARWEGRENGRIHVDSSRVSKRMMERAKPQVIKHLSRVANEARCSKLPGEHRTQIAKKASDARWKKQGRKQTKRARNKRAWYRKSMAERLSARAAKKQVEVTA